MNFFDKTSPIAEKTFFMTIDKDTKVSGPMLYPDISKSKEISRFQPIDEALHDCFSATKTSFQKLPKLFIRSRVLSSHGFNEKRIEIASKIMREQTDRQSTIALCLLSTLGSIMTNMQATVDIIDYTWLKHLVEMLVIDFFPFIVDFKKSCF